MRVLTPTYSCTSCRSVPARNACRIVPGQCTVLRRQQQALGRCQGIVARAAAVSQSEGENVVSTQELREVTKDDFYSCLDEAGNKLVIVDFYTNWCGPCKVIYPKLLEMQDKYASNALFVKFNCNKANKDLGQALGIKVAPTFQLYRNGNKVAELTGAKAEELQELIDKHIA